MPAPMVPAAPPAANANSTAAPATEVAAGDFLLMLGQLLGAPVAQTTARPATPATTTGDAELDLDAVAQDAAALTGAPIPVPPAPLLPQLAGNAEQGATTTVAAAKPLVAGLPAQELLDTMATTDEQGAPATPAPTLSMTTDVSQQLRVTAAPDPGQTRPLHQSVGSSQWADELGTRMLLMSERGQHSASLRLNPEHLGPLEVRISVRDDQASVWFGSAQADTRAALEQALPRLRELFASQGLSLADAGVHHQASREQGRHAAAGGTATGGTNESEAAPVVRIAARPGLVDEYV